MMKFIYPLILLMLILLSCQRPKSSLPDEPDTSQTYNESYRPRYHFSPLANWMNDPNGMVYYEGEYHLFYQYYPDSTVWGPMHWGHAVSRDMIHWEHLPVALYPDSLGYIFSGSAVADINNTSGFGSEDNPPLVAIFTHHQPEKAKAGDDDYQYQSLAYSQDRGRTWKKYEGNPVLPNLEHKEDFRDPKVFWYAAGQHWVMVLAVKDHVELYTSPDLKKWAYLSEFGASAGAHSGVWECPDLFPLRADTGEEKWVLLLSINPGGPVGGSATQYFVGDFDGVTFTSDFRENDYRWLDGGADNYAGVTWSNVPQSDGRRLFLGWMSNWEYAQVVPTEKWRSAMTLPRRLDLKHDRRKTWIVSANPVKEADKLKRDFVSIKRRMIFGKADLSEYIQGGAFYLDLELVRTRDHFDFEIELSNGLGERAVFGYADKDMKFYFDRSASGETGFSATFGDRHEVVFSLRSDTLRLEVFVDHSSVELFADHGKLVMTEIVFPKTPYTNFSINTKDQALVLNAEIASLKKIWKED